MTGMTGMTSNPRRGSGFFLGGPRKVIQEQKAQEGPFQGLDGPTGPGTSPGRPARLPTPVPGTSGATNKRPVPTTGTQLSRLLFQKSLQLTDCHI